MLLPRIAATLGLIIVVAAVLIGLFWEQLPIRLILPYFQPQPIGIEGQVQKMTITGSNALVS